MKQTQQAFYSGFPWTIHRNKSGWPRWWQRFYEAWLVVTGKYSFWHAWDHGQHVGAMNEYRRIVIHGGDLGPLLNAAVEALCPGDMSEAKQREKRRAIWMRYESGRNDVLAETPQSSC